MIWLWLTIMIMIEIMIDYSKQVSLCNQYGITFETADIDFTIDDISFYC